MVHGIWTMLNLHINWVVLQANVCNTFNLMSWSAILQELRYSHNSLDQLFPLVWWFYACLSPLYFFQASQRGDIIVISSELSTWQGDPLGGMLFTMFTFALFVLQHNLPYLCFPFVGKWYIYSSRSRIKCGSYFFTIITRVFSIRALSVANEVCSLFSIGVGPFYIISS